MNKRTLSVVISLVVIVAMFSQTLLASSAFRQTEITQPADEFTPHRESKHLVCDVPSTLLSGKITPEDLGWWLSEMDRLYVAMADFVGGANGWTPRGLTGGDDKVLVNYDPDTYMTAHVGRTQFNLGPQGVERGIIKSVNEKPRLYWGPVHELGHNFGRYPAFDVEWTASFIGLYASAIATGIPTERHNGTLDSWYQSEHGFAIQDEEEDKRIGNKLSAAIMNFSRDHGWEAIRKTFGSYHDGSYPNDGQKYGGTRRSIAFNEFIDRIDYFGKVDFRAAYLATMEGNSGKSWLQVLDEQFPKTIKQQGGGSSLSAEGLLARTVPALVGKVMFVEIPPEDGKDVFELQTKEGKLVISGNNGVSMASGLHWYLKHYCHCQISLRAQQLNLPDPLPPIAEKVRIVSPYKYRYYFNYCAFSYTMAWWHWSDWERMIDLMALYGINAPLSVTGQEGVWRNAGKRLGLSEEQMQDFYVGPGYLPFGWMGCIDRWAGPLPNAWIDDHVELQKKILQRQRGLGMTPILQGFTGHVPQKLQEVNKDVKLVELSPWCGFPPTYFVDPGDPNFIEVGKIFLEEQTKLFGTNHLYASDTFIEMPPKNNDPEFLRKMGRSIYESMRVVDPEAIWVLQSWPFCVYYPNFWLPPQAEAFFCSVPQGRLLLLDMYCERTPGWTRFDGAFFGQPWAWGIIQHFGDQVSLHGGIDFMAADLRKAIEQRGKKAGNMVGLCYVMEGLGYNPIIDEFHSDMTWRDSVPDTKEWRGEFVKRWYGADSPKAQAVWERLHQTAYQQRGHMENHPLTRRPALTPPAKELDKTFVPIWKALLDCADELGNERTYRYDVTNVTRHTLGMLALLYQAELVNAYFSKDRAALKEAAGKLEGLIHDVDRQLATDTEFLLGTWLDNAKRWGHTEEEKRHYEWNARMIITRWGGALYLDDYAAKQWAGMMRDYYGRRWNRLYEAFDHSLAEGTSWDAERFQADILKWQDDWAKETSVFPTKPSEEDPVLVAKSLYEKYAGEFDREFPQPDFISSGKTFVSPKDYPDVVSLTTGKPAVASDTLPGFGARFANDGKRNNPDSYWACDVGGKSDSWWQVDLERPTEVNRVVVVGFYADRRYYGFLVEGSLDGQNWTMLSDFRENKELSTIDGYDCRFETTTVRYLRVTQTYCSANTGRILVEVMAFGPEE